MEGENAEAQEGEENKRKRYPHQKAPKNLSTDQFLEKLHADEDGEQPAEGEGKEAQKEHKRRRRGGRGRHRDGGQREGGQANTAAESKGENKE